MQFNWKVNVKSTLALLSVLILLVIPSVMAAATEPGKLSSYGTVSSLLAVLASWANLARYRFKQFKRVFDFGLALVALMLSLPFVLVFALMIKLISPGPVFYGQNRVGRNGKIFRIYKLRTMRQNAEKESGAVWARGESDPRVIPVIGGFLRQTHLDELPQFFNVLKGEMSVIGPRPERPEMVSVLKDQISEYEKRLRVRPGITGLAQVRHRYDQTLIDVKKKVKLDLLYIRRMCFLAEINILAKTVRVVFKGQELN